MVNAFGRRRMAGTPSDHVTWKKRLWFCWDKFDWLKILGRFPYPVISKCKTNRSFFARNMKLSSYCRLFNNIVWKYCVLWLPMVSLFLIGFLSRYSIFTAALAQPQLTTSLVLSKIVHLCRLSCCHFAYDIALSRLGDSMFLVFFEVVRSHGNSWRMWSSLFIPGCRSNFHYWNWFVVDWRCWTLL